MGLVSGVAAAMVVSIWLESDQSKVTRLIDRIEQTESSYEAEPYVEKIRLMGTNAIPALIHLLELPAPSKFRSLMNDRLPDWAPEFLRLSHPQDRANVAVSKFKALEIDDQRVALGQMLKSLTRSTNAAATGNIMEAIGFLDEEVTVELQAQLASGDLRTKRAIASLYGGSDVGPPPLATLEPYLVSEDEAIRRSLTYALHYYDHTKVDVLPYASTSARDESATVRYAAIMVLSQLHGQTDRVVPELIRLLDDSDSEVRKTAAAQLTRFGTNAVAALPKLRRMSKNETNAPTRNWPKWVIAEIEASIRRSNAVETSSDSEPPVSNQ